MVVSGSVLAIPVATHQQNDGQVSASGVDNRTGTSINALSYSAPSAHWANSTGVSRLRDDFTGLDGGGSRIRSGSSATLSILPMEPIPEPATVVLLGIGLACAAGVRRYRQKQA